MRTKQKPRYTDNCWRRKMGCQSGHPQAYMLEYTWNIFLGCLGIPKLELLPLFILLTSVTPRSSNTSSTQKLNKNFVRSVSIIKQITTFMYCYKLTINLYWCNIYFIPNFPRFTPPPPRTSRQHSKKTKET